MLISVLFQSAHVMAEQEVLIDSGATDNFVSPQLLKWLGISTLPVKVPIRIWNVDGTHNQGGAITHYTDLEVRTGEQKKTLRFLITNLGRDEVILGYPWSTAFEPRFHWQDATLDEEFHPVIISSLRLKHPYHLLESTIRKTTTATSLAQQAAGKTKPKLEELIPPEYLRHQKIFSEQASRRFPPSREWDHTIDLLPNAPSSINCKVYPMPTTWKQCPRQIPPRTTRSNYIHPSKSPYAAPLFFIGKKDGDVRPVQDYRVPNSYTVKNNHPLPLISKLIDQVAKALLFSKVDIQKGFNNIQMKEGDEWKAAFKTNRGLFETTVMFFGLTNSPSTFQSMMDTIFKDLILTGKVVIYMDDILIATPDNLTHHRQLVHRVLDQLEEHDLYLKPKEMHLWSTRSRVPRGYSGTWASRHGPSKGQRRTRLANTSEPERCTILPGVL